MNRITNSTSKYVPPIGKIYTGTGSGSFIVQGEHQLNLLKTYINIQADDCVLDIGSGIGRTAIPLTQHLSREGRYEGFDVVKEGVDWCNKKIKADFPQFNFQFVNLKNDLYNTSNENAENFRFPYPDGVFDKVFLFSVFTHMSLLEVRQYFLEIDRVLKPNGMCLATFFVYDDKNEGTIAKNENFAFPFKKEGHRLMSEKVTSANVAFDVKTIESFLDITNLKEVKHIDGFWKQDVTKSESNDFQDIIVLQKNSH